MSDQRDPETDQQLPEKNRHPVIQELIIAESQNRPNIERLIVTQAMEESLAIGVKKYGTGLQPFNGRDPLLDLEQELRDAMVYARQLRWERDNPPVTDGLEALRAGMAQFLSVLEPAYAERSPDQVHDWAVSMVDQYLSKAVSTIRREAFERGASPAVGVLLAEIQEADPGKYRDGLERAVQLLTQEHSARYRDAYQRGVKAGREQWAEQHARENAAARRVNPLPEV